jgi:hypothetical protein
MSNKAIILSLAIFVVIVGGMFGFAYLKQAEIETVTPPPAADATTTENIYGISRIEATHFYIDGVHTIVGEIMVPTPCDLLTAEARVAESMPEQVTFDFTIVNDSEMCAQVISMQRFKVSASASQAASLGATFMGQPIELNLKEAAPGETPEDFEVFIKG